ncbi:hypothetical protein PG993_003255 [Apiospora rasikravindrae]|uniref:Glucose-methanol-choline oxidoreductase C-terminal domain-containing protein n=1 Tax=Apiospora rasikravindrae TaxID=990691 RepID=A0ABR1TYX0_9PEZI
MDLLRWLNRFRGHDNLLGPAFRQRHAGPLPGHMQYHEGVARHRPALPVAPRSTSTSACWPCRQPLSSSNPERGHKHAGIEFNLNGTTAMMLRSKGGMVDHSLKVYGTQDLMAMDASVMAMIPMAHIQDAAICAAAEKVDLLPSVADSDLETPHTPLNGCCRLMPTGCGHHPNQGLDESGGD